MGTHVPQETVETLLLTQTVGLLHLMQRMGEHLRTEVRALFPTLTPAEHQAVCVRVVHIMKEALAPAGLDAERRDDDQR
jgi:hypothetical protein